MEREAFLVGGVRTPIGRYGGALAAVRPDDLAALAVSEAVQRADIAPEVIDEVILGAANQAGEDNRNVARMAVLLAGFPEHVPGYTVNRLCASGLTAVINAAQAVLAGHADVVVAGGVESMTRAPWVQAKPERAWSRPGEVADSVLGWRFVNPRMREVDGGEATLSLGETAEKVARMDGISRHESDAYSLRSHERAIAAVEKGWFTGEIVPVPTPRSDVVKADEGPRVDSDMARLARLRPVFADDGIITAGASSQLSDGAAAIVVASGQAVTRYGLRPRARLVDVASAGVAPSTMGLGPVPATRKVLDRAGWEISDLDAVELNEAFAPQVLACVRRLGLELNTVNADGGAIALGHPLGCSGTRILVTLLGRLERDGGRRGLATLCVGVGQGVSALVERV